MIEEATLRDIVEKHIAVIQALRYSEGAKPHYDLLGDMIFWDDEMPEGPFELVNCMRIIFHLRTRRAIADRDIGTSFWIWASGRVPSWPGFQMGRCDAVRLRALYEELRVPTELPPE